MTSEAFKEFEKSVGIIAGKIKPFVSTAEMMIKDHHYDSRRIRHEVDELQKKWTAFHTSIGEYRGSLDDAAKFYNVWDDVS